MVDYLLPKELINGGDLKVRRQQRQRQRKRQKKEEVL